MGILGIVAAGIAGALCVVGCQNRSSSATASTTKAEPTPTVAPVHELAPAEVIIAYPTLGDAIHYAKPMMDDTPNKQSQGSALLAIWAMKRMQWSDVGVAKDETTFALVQKDADEERGKRLCATGTIVEIHTDKTAGGKMYEGLLMTPADKIYSYMTVGGSGRLVEQSSARVCGVVTGKYDYSNSGGGTSHAVVLVGMFDLPENKPLVPPVNKVAVAAKSDTTACREACVRTVRNEMDLDDCVVACGKQK